MVPVGYVTESKSLPPLKMRYESPLIFNQLRLFRFNKQHFPVFTIHHSAPFFLPLSLRLNFNGLPPKFMQKAV
ncbi:MAG: hypothetical protein JWQ40_2205 [Segetibacter sp.]|nr:hypothetical protein [Segetibacter sp.]